ncbi:MAG: phenylacetate--CoA ligase family protein [Deltaproteobacteria bacterium]|nr:phenylacetate--CoA ligase family protein [Deltaproteobacteria bacterium]
MRQSETWTASQIQSYQTEQLRKMVEHGYLNTSGYHELYESRGISPTAIRELGDLKALPFVTKELLRDNLEAFSAAWPGRSRVTTGGSTGIPFGFYRDPVAFARELASKAHQYYRIGWREGDRQLVLRGLPIDTPDHIQYVPEFEELRCSSYHLVPEHMRIFLERANEYKPKWLRCYPSSGYIFAHFVEENRQHIPSLKGILCASENLYDYQRAYLTKVFGVRVFSHYGHYEQAALAGYCEYQDTYHVLPQYGIAELVDERGEQVVKPGDVGEIVATSLIMYATPFIRYRTRDFAIFKGTGCETCGRPYQVWERIEGRLQEFIVTATGRHISMTSINMHDDTFDDVQQFQFEQCTKGHLEFHYIPKSTWDDDAAEKIRKRLLSKLGPDVNLSMSPVKSIPLTVRGKHRFLIQHLQLTYGDA